MTESKRKKNTFTKTKKYEMYKGRFVESLSYRKIEEDLQSTCLNYRFGKISYLDISKVNENSILAAVILSFYENGIPSSIETFSGKNGYKADITEEGIAYDEEDYISEYKYGCGYGCIAYIEDASSAIKRKAIFKKEIKRTANILRERICEKIICCNKFIITRYFYTTNNSQYIDLMRNEFFSWVESTIACLKKKELLSDYGVGNIFRESFYDNNDNMYCTENPPVVNQEIVIQKDGKINFILTKDETNVKRNMHGIIFGKNGLAKTIALCNCRSFSPFYDENNDTKKYNFRANGMIYSSEKMIYGKKDGLKIFYDKNGNQDYTILYDEGMRITKTPCIKPSKRITVTSKEDTK